MVKYNMATIYVEFLLFADKFSTCGMLIFDVVKKYFMLLFHANPLCFLCVL